MEKVPWSRRIYFEAARFEEKRHCDEKAINIVSRGLIQNSRFGPLWFCAFRLHEKIEVKRALSVFDEGKAEREEKCAFDNCADPHASRLRQSDRGRSKGVAMES